LQLALWNVETTAALSYYPEVTLSCSGVRVSFAPELWSSMCSHMKWGVGIDADADTVLRKEANLFAEALSAAARCGNHHGGFTAVAMPASDRNVDSLRAWVTAELLRVSVVTEVCVP
jgi:hypothetical protein